jgi:calreticulin
MRFLALLALLGLLLVVSVSATTYFKEEFDNSWQSRWVVSDWKKDEGTRGDWKLTATEWYGDAEADKGIQTSQDARFYAISAKLDKPFSNEGKDLILQYSVKFPQKIDCGGGYIKLLPAGTDQQNFNGDSKYYIMFGPDICGTSTKKTHVIFNYKEQNHLIKKNINCETDQLTHVYTLIVHPDNTYEVNIDGEKKESGSLLEDWDFLAPKTIKDPSVSKPSDWVDDPLIDDPADSKPAGYDSTPKQIPDPDAEKPSDWDDEADGEWQVNQPHHIAPQSLLSLKLIY